MIGILSCFVKTVQYVQTLLSWASYPSLTWSIRLHSFEWRQDAGVDFHNRVQFRPQDFLLTPSYFSELLFSATIFYFVYQAIFVWMVTKCILIFDIQVQFRKYVFVFSLFFQDWCSCILFSILFIQQHSFARRRQGVSKNGIKFRIFRFSFPSDFFFARFSIVSIHSHWFKWLKANFFERLKIPTQFV